MKWSEINAVNVNVHVKSSGNINQLLGMLYSMVDKFRLRNNISLPICWVVIDVRLVKRLRSVVNMLVYKEIIEVFMSWDNWTYTFNDYFKKDIEL